VAFCYSHRHLVGSHGTCTVAMEGVADESLAVVLTFCPAQATLSLAVCSSRFTDVARADVLWLPLAGRRWRFGALPGSGVPLPPGARDRASESALADAAQAPPCQRTGAFAFFERRCRLDAEVATLTLQWDVAAHADAKDPGAELPAGCAVTLTGLASSPQYNGASGVVRGPVPDGSGRLRVELAPLLRSLSIRGQNLSLVGPPLGQAEAEARVLEHGAEAVDALARVVRAAPSGSSTRAAARHLLAAATEQWAIQQWQLLLGDPDRVDLLEEGGLVVSQWAAPGEADVAAVRARLDEIAGIAEARVHPGMGLQERVDVVSSVLFDECGFFGNRDDYYDPRNSLLHCVLERRCGIPISLSIIWAAVARRLGLQCFLCANFPAHILVRVDAGGQSLRDDLYIDAFNRQVLDYNGLLQFTRTLGSWNFQEEFVVRRPATAVYARLLRNLINIYTERTSHARGATSAAEKLHNVIGACSQAITIADAYSHPEVEQLRQVRDHAKAQLR